MIGVVPTLGVTFTCQYEPVQAVHEALDKLQEETGLDIPIHVDGASEFAFLAPFCDPDLSRDAVTTVDTVMPLDIRFGLFPHLALVGLFGGEMPMLTMTIFEKINYTSVKHARLCAQFFSPWWSNRFAPYYNFLRLGKEGYP
ncbi:pyridoxal-dependent decarboxylase [Vibrio chagasii]|nr:pyridoxal-dependent decarboxylase [Vibrio chagasii]